MFIWILALSLWRTLWSTCHVMGRNLTIGFLDKINLFFFSTFLICVCVFCGECGFICMIIICVADISCDYPDWMRAITMNDYMAHICMIIICITPHIIVWLLTLTAISVNGWQYQCMSGNQRMYASMYYIQSNFFLFITQIILLVFF